METQKYTVPVTVTKTKMVPVTKKVPKTVYVDVTEHVPQKYTTTKMETRERQVPVPYYVNVPETKYRTVTEKVPVSKTKVKMETVTKTVYDSKVRTRCIPETKIVTKRIPVYTVVANPARVCPPSTGQVMEDYKGIEKSSDGMSNYSQVASEVPDTNKGGQVSQNEYHSENLSKTEGYGNRTNDQSTARAASTYGNTKSQR